MIYLFNSGFNPLYRSNTLKTLLLPSGIRNEFRYRFKGERTNSPPAATFSGSVGQEVLISFIDRYAPGGYRYLPIRKGKLVGHRVHGDQQFFEVELEKVIWPLDPDSVSRQISERLGPMGLAHLEGSPTNTHDGFYALVGDALFDDQSRFAEGDEAWTKATSALNQVQAYASTSGRRTLFGSLALGDGVEIRDGGFELKRGSPATVMLRYHFPINEGSTHETLDGHVKPSVGITPLSGESFLIDAAMNSVPITLLVPRGGDERAGSVQVSFDSKDGVELIAPTATIGLTVRETAGFWFSTLAWLIVYAITVSIAKMTFDAGVSFGAILSQLTPVGLGASIISGFALLKLFRLVGKKFL